MRLLRAPISLIFCLLQFPDSSFRNPVTPVAVDQAVFVSGFSPSFLLSASSSPVHMASRFNLGSISRPNWKTSSGLSLM